jgi:dihydrodipicolinate synthase/N-acetylneuraminate lyase
MVIPAHPLALTAARKLDERRQRALTRYYLDAGASGVAVGVHTTQFAIRSPKVGLYRPVLALAAETAAEWEGRRGKPVLRVAGVVGKTRQAVSEARVARDLGYDVGLLSLGALARATDAQLIDHCRVVAETIPLMGFYLQPSVGGRVLSYSFWRRFVEIESVVAIKIAPFNRYATLDVVRAVADAGREKEVALLTGNDDSIVADLLARYRFRRGHEDVVLRMAGGLLGHWAFWTRAAVKMVDRVVGARARAVPAGLLSLGAATTDANGAIFDAANGFRGCIPGIHEILRRQGLLRGRWCLDPREELSPGQMREIDRVIAAYPGLSDDAFVKANLDRWMA